MRIKCETCKGKGYIEHITTCSKCAGLGSIKISLGQGNEQNQKCDKCDGKGKFIDKEVCPEDCEEGFHYICDFCGKEVSRNDQFVCEDCKSAPYIVKLIPPLDDNYLDGHHAFLATVTKVYNEDVYVSIGDRSLGYSGQFKSPNPKMYYIGMPIAVRARNPLENRPGWKNYVVPIKHDKYDVKIVHKDVVNRSIAEFLEKGVDNITAKFTAQILYIKQIGKGPTFYKLIDASGTIIQGVGFNINDSIGHSHISRYSVVEVIGEMHLFRNEEQFKIYALKPVQYEQRQKFYDVLANVVVGKGSLISETPLSIESDLYSKIYSPLTQAGREIRKAIITGRNILLRYQANNVDNTVGAFAIDLALRALLRSRGRHSDEYRHIIRRLPLKGNVYEASDIIRDISFVLDGPVSGEKMPLVVLIGVGSTKESLPAYHIAEEYDLPVVVVDNHNVDDDVADFVDILVNASLITDEYRISAGMIAYELARLVYAERDLKFNHLAAVCALAANASGIETEKYLEILASTDLSVVSAELDDVREETSDESEKVQPSTLTEEDLQIVIAAMEYLLTDLRYYDGGEVMRDVLQIGKKKSRGKALTEAIGTLSQNLVNAALATLQNKGEVSTVGDAEVTVVDLELYAPRYEFPTHGLLMSKLHESKKLGAKKGITIGIGQDYAILHASNYSYDFSKLLTELREKLPLAHISGGGYGNAGSIQFLLGFKDEFKTGLLSLL